MLPYIPTVYFSNPGTPYDPCKTLTDSVAFNFNPRNFGQIVMMIHAANFTNSSKRIIMKYIASKQQLSFMLRREMQQPMKHIVMMTIPKKKQLVLVKLLFLDRSNPKLSVQMRHKETEDVSGPSTDLIHLALQSKAMKAEVVCCP